MTTVYIGERQSGKTTTLIEMSEKTGATIDRSSLNIHLLKHHLKLVNEILLRFTESAACEKPDVIGNRDGNRDLLTHLSRSHLNIFAH